MYYAAVNSYATETSVGFANTWAVVGFATRQMRDAYVHRSRDLATRAITSKELRNYGGKPGKVNYYDVDGCYYDYQDGWDGKFFKTLRAINPVTAELITDDCGR